MTGPSVYTIPAGVPFAATLATGLLARTKGQPEALAQMRILLPTRRACRVLRGAFLRQSEGAPLLLPVMQPLGDADEDEIGFFGSETGDPATMLDLPPALSPLRRQLILSRLIRARGDMGPAQALRLAQALGKLLDQMAIEGLGAAGLENLVPAEFAAHWQVTLEFLQIVTAAWPGILAEMGVMDAVARRTALINRMAEHWRVTPPSGPVVAAGSTGSIPASARLLSVVAGLPQGEVILPGLDTALDHESWEAVGPTHPQYMMKNLIERIGVERRHVAVWPGADANAQTTRRNDLMREVMRPASTTDAWTRLGPGDEATLRGVRLYDCDTAEDEARLIALLIRQTLEQPGKTVSVITPDRVLARRVAALCRRWSLDIDDSAGHALDKTKQGAFFLLAAQACVARFAPVPLLSLLKHDLCLMGLDRVPARQAVCTLEESALRGLRPDPGLAGLRARDTAGRSTPLLDRIEACTRDFTLLCDQGAVAARTLLDAHIAMAESLAATAAQGGAEHLWRDEAGEALSLFLSELYEQADQLGAVTPQAYNDILRELLAAPVVRPTWGSHPRVAILGQMEARLIDSDLIVMAGLNEGTWPPGPEADPWMSRPMRQKFGLPDPDRGIGQSAHDFVQGFCLKQVAMTRAARVDGAPTVPARWLERLRTVRTAMKIDASCLRDGDMHHWLQRLDRPGGAPVPAQRPAPRPPVAARPRQLPVTAIESWMRDPYALYARYVLRLKKLEALDRPLEAADRGSMIHDILNRFIADSPDRLPEDAVQQLCDRARQDWAAHFDDPAFSGFWWPRFERLAAWFIATERDWRGEARPARLEIGGKTDLDGPAGPFTLTAKADRIDRLHTGGYCIIDYKTGSVPSKSDVDRGLSPQLPLEGLILRQGGFSGLSGEAESFQYWKLSGATAESGKVTRFDAAGKTKPPAQLIEEAEDGLRALITAYDDPATPYLSLPDPDRAPPPARQDYALLARVQEWAVIEGAEDSA